jgi:serine/threonine protein kinase
MQQEEMTFPVGATVRDPNGDRYVIEGFLGTGGFGAVYLVRDRRVKHNLFALKEVIDPNKQDREHFTLEAEILKRLEHRALPRVYRVFEHDKLKRVYMLMDYIQGQDLEVLRQEQAEQRFSLSLVLALLAPVVDALIYLHHQDPPIVHRDIKPANIIVPTRGSEALLVDFGIAKEYVEERTTTVIRHGSPGYAALEQYGSGTTPRTDIYGLGATLYALLTGTIPTDAITRASASKGIDPLKPANLITPAVPMAVATTIQRAMSISSEDRFATIEEFWQELLDHASQQQLPRMTSFSTAQRLVVSKQEREHVVAASLPKQRLVPRARKRDIFLLTVLALLVIVVLGMSFSSYVLGRGGAPPAPQRATNSSVASSRVTSAVVSPTSTPTPGSSIYPGLAASYTGTVGDLLAKEKTAMFLTNIHQNQGSIRGIFRGLGLVGLFRGTITPAGHLQITVTIYAGNESLAFEGVIKVGGDIAGSYAVLDRNGEHTGEVGLWNVAPNP